MQYPEVRALAATTHEVISRSVILELISERTLNRWQSKHWLFQWAPRAYGFVEKPEWRQQLHAIHVSSPELAVSHRSAVRLWSIAPIFTWDMEFVGPRSSRRLPQTTVHETNFLPPFHLTRREGTLVTTPARSIVDVGAVWGPDRLRSIVNSALDKRITTIGELRRTVEAVHSRGRRTRFLEEIIFDSRYDDAKSASELERKGLSLIRAAGLPSPSKQYAISLESFTLHPDLCYPDIKLAIEFDGYEAHGTHFAFHDDRKRDALLTIEGWHVVRFSFRTLHLLVPTVRARFAQLKESSPLSAVSGGF